MANRDNRSTADPTTSKRKPSQELSCPMLKRVNSTGDIHSESTHEIPLLQEIVQKTVADELNDRIETAVLRAMKPLLDVVQVSQSKINDLSKDLRNVVDKLSERDKLIDVYEKRLNKLENELSNVRSQCDETNKSLVDLKSTNMLLHDKAEQYSRRENVRITGLQLEESDSTDTAICKLAQKIGVKLSLQDISRSHFIGRHRQQIIVKFNSYRKKYEFITSRKKLKQSPGATGEFINEDLTKYRFGLFKVLLGYKKEGKVFAVWTQDGNIFVRKAEHGDRVQINQELDLQKLTALDAVNPQLFTIATLTGHAIRAMGPNYSIIMDNGPAAKLNTARKVQAAGESMGDPFEVSTIRRDDYDFHKGKSEYEDLLSANNQASSATSRGHQSPSAFMIMASGLDKHGIDSERPLPYSHIDIAGSSGPFPGIPTGAPIVALATHFVLGRLQQPSGNATSA